MWKQVSLASKTSKHEPTYYLTVTTMAVGASSYKIRKIEAPFTTWFTADGYFVAKPFQQWLASSVPVIGDADLKNSAPVEQSMVDSEINGTPSSSGVDTGKGSKRSKKKA